MSKNISQKKYEDYELEDFLTDEFFTQWVKSPNENNSHFWEKWLNSNHKKSDLVRKAAGFIRSIQYQENAELSNEDYIEVFENILKGDLSATPIKSKNSNSTKWYSFFSIRWAAAIVLIVFCSWALFESKIYSDGEASEVVWVTKVNAAGKKTIIHLSDGTSIHLNSNSKISYPENFSDSLRIVSIEGEAFFDVIKEERPFIVELQNAKIEVLGTTFNVNNTNEDKVEIALVSGKVKVNDNIGNQIMLAPTEMIVLEKNGQFSKKKFDLRSITGWKDKYLIFTEDDFDTVIQKIERWYGVDITAAGEFKEHWAYTGQYHDESLENVLEGIAQTSKISYSINGKKVEITK
ncbi:FecR family protein [Algoriphagus winogradskyi]|uniref:FecR family protein n=1 Tax=Algoriphagus winogradskyi TaxID=237017 RepID=A0ABY1NBF9_9BACT|nr:FecR family protein [Algoriphagus winogradskyi]SMP05495.1 FecR family protein [Algoriphagus winogradskyi]